MHERLPHLDPEGVTLVDPSEVGRHAIGEVIRSEDPAAQ